MLFHLHLNAGPSNQKVLVEMFQRMAIIDRPQAKAPFLGAIS
jgi:hypothetical protein